MTLRDSGDTGDAYSGAPSAPENGRLAPSVLALTPAQTEAALATLGGRPFHARSLRRHVFEGRLDPATWTDLGKGLRAAIGERLPPLCGAEVTRRAAPDGTMKLLTRFAAAPAMVAPDGSRTPARAGGSVETVHIPSRRPDRGATVCTSTQIGCPVRCPFCASGKDGLVRGLAGHEILEQYVRARAIGPFARTVVMGIREPLLNWPALDFALSAVRDEMGLGARRITVSTVGFPDRLRQLAPTRPGFQLAISLHSPDDEQRWRLVPLMAGVPIEAVLDAGDHWFAATGREVTYEYVLLGGENDSDGHARRLADRLARRRATVNLIPYNPVDGDPFRRPDESAVARFHEQLAARGIVATVRWSRGLEAEAACGQLRQRAGP